MTTPLEKTLKRELSINGGAYVLAISPEGLKLTVKGRRKGLELQWDALVSGDAALAIALNASLGQLQSKERAAPKARPEEKPEEKPAAAAPAKPAPAPVVKPAKSAGETSGMSRGRTASKARPAARKGASRRGASVRS
jgi:hypothetical protein